MQLPLQTICWQLFWTTISSRAMSLELIRGRLSGNAVMDMNDRVLRNIVVGLGSKMDGMVREDHFVITVASEIMAILCLADDMHDLKRRLGRIIVAYTFDGKPVTADDLQSNRRDGGTVKGCVEAEPHPDVRAHTGHCSRWSVRQYCTRMQQCPCYKDSLKARGLCDYGGRLWRRSRR